MGELLILTCSGRPVDDAGQPYGDLCGKTFKRSGRQARPEWAYEYSGGQVVSMQWLGPPVEVTPVDEAEYRNEARSAGWSIGPNDEATCPKCRKPDPVTVRHCREIQRSLP
jgi:hypothetical protein